MRSINKRTQKTPDDAEPGIGEGRGDQSKKPHTEGWWSIHHSISASGPYFLRVLTPLAGSISSPSESSLGFFIFSGLGNS